MFKSMRQSRLPNCVRGHQRSEGERKQGVVLAGRVKQGGAGLGKETFFHWSCGMGVAAGQVGTCAFGVHFPTLGAQGYCISEISTRAFEPAMLDTSLEHKLGEGRDFYSCLDVHINSKSRLNLGRKSPHSENVKPDPNSSKSSTVGGTVLLTHPQRPVEKLTRPISVLCTNELLANDAHGG